ncbi:contact-dependent growth inhibition system immunity protein [Amycolatopsis thailandensis]|uniref:contact-dependent growth inhibition system immunity protein n=1 Tax=Amycolatopsis thailandensis TaxID=589330 RepID=UPI003653CD64
MLGYLASVYFHQDHDLHGGSAAEVVRTFVKEESFEVSNQLLLELDELKKSDLTEDMARQLWLDEYDAQYEPDVRDGISYLEWFDQVRREVEGQLARESQG